MIYYDDLLMGSAAVISGQHLDYLRGVAPVALQKDLQGFDLLGVLGKLLDEDGRIGLGTTDQNVQSFSWIVL